MPTIKHSRSVLAGTAPRPQSAGAVHAAKFRHNFAEALAAGAILELGILPAFSQIVDYKLVPEGDFGTVTASGGLVSGDLASSDTSRAVGTELFSAATALSANASPLKATALNIDSKDKDRGLGLTFSAAVTADATKKLTLLVFYTQ